MWRYCFLIVLLLAGCGEARVEVLPTVGVETSFPTPTATLAQPTAVMPPPTQTPVSNTPTQIVSSVVPINTPTPTPIPMSPTETPLPPVKWSAAVEFVRSVKSETIHWSPVANEFVVSCPTTSTTDFGQDNSIIFFVAPEFLSEKITPEGLICPALFGGAVSIWQPDGEKIFVCANSVSQAPDFVDLFCNIWHISKEGISIQTTGVVEARQLTFNGWMDNENLVYSNYVSGGSWDIFIYNSEQDEIVAHAGIHVGDVLAVSDKYVVTASGADYYFERSAAVFNTTQIREDDRRFLGGSYIRYLSFETDNDQFQVKFNSTPLDWLAAANQMLVLTWEADAELWNVDLLHDSPVTDLQLWDVEADTLTLLVPGAVDGRFSPDGRFLAFLTPGNPAPFLQLLNRIDGTVAFAVQTVDTNFHIAYPTANISFSPDSRYAVFFTPGPLTLDNDGKPSSVMFEPDASYLTLLDLETMRVIRSLSAPAEIVLWSPDSRRFVYQTPDDILAVFDVHKGRAAPIVNSGGERLSHPQWSFDGSYLSVQVRNAVWWETAVLRMP